MSWAVPGRGTAGLGAHTVGTSLPPTPLVFYFTNSITRVLTSMELLRAAAQGRDHPHFNPTPSSLLLHEGHSSARRRMGFTAPWHTQDRHCSQGRKLCSCANTRTKAWETPVPTPVSSSHRADSSTAQLCLHSLPAAAPLHPRCAGTRRAQGEASCLIFCMSQGCGIEASCRKRPRVCVLLQALLTPVLGRESSPVPPCTRPAAH